MNKQLAAKILIEINKPSILDCLKEYIESRKQALLKEYEGTTDNDQMIRIQGQLRELTRLLHIRTDAVAIVERKE